LYQVHVVVKHFEQGYYSTKVTVIMLVQQHHHITYLLWTFCWPAIEHAESAAADVLGQPIGRVRSQGLCSTPTQLSPVHNKSIFTQLWKCISLTVCLYLFQH